jgi:hypothetical protein
VLDDLSLAENYCYDPRQQNVRSYQVAPYFGKVGEGGEGKEEKKVSFAFWPDLLRRYLHKYKADDLFAKNYIESLEGQINASQERLKEEWASYQKGLLREKHHRPTHTIPEAQAALVDLLSTPSCEREQTCAPTQTCTVGFCLDRALI